jgi:DNA-binding IscR family transcriptional regulator
MADVVSVIEGESLGAKTSSHRAAAGAISDVWRQVGEAMAAILRRQSLESLLKRRKAALTFQI